MKEQFISDENRIRIGSVVCTLIVLWIVLNAITGCSARHAPLPIRAQDLLNQQTPEEKTEDHCFKPEEKPTCQGRYKPG